MLDFIGPRFHNCDRMARRDVLRVGGLALGGATLADTLRRQSHAGDPRGSPTDTAVIQIFLGGGPSQLDTYDMKPTAPAEIRGEFSEIPTNVPGYRMCEHLPLQASMMDKLAIVRTVSHTNSSHLPSSHLMQTGYEIPEATAVQNMHPSTSSITARMRPASSTGMPTYVAVPRGQAFSYAAYLGTRYNPFTTDVEPNADVFEVPNLKLPAGISHDRLLRRHDLLRELDDVKRRLESTSDMVGLDSFNRQALELLTSPLIGNASTSLVSRPAYVSDMGARRWGKTAYWRVGWLKRESATSAAFQAGDGTRTKTISYPSENCCCPGLIRRSRHW